MDPISARKYYSLLSSPPVYTCIPHFLSPTVCNPESEQHLTLTLHPIHRRSVDIHRPMAEWLGERHEPVLLRSPVTAQPFETTQISSKHTLTKATALTTTCAFAHRPCNFLAQTNLVLPPLGDPWYISSLSISQSTEQTSLRLR